MADYRLGIPLLDDRLSPVRAGTNLMIVGPPLSGADLLVYNILRAGLADGEAGILVSTGMGGEDCLEALRSHNADPFTSDGPLGVVDCLSQTIGMNAGDTDLIKRVSSPVNLTGIAVAATAFLQEFWTKRRSRKMRFVVHNLSTMLLYSDVRTVFRFLHVFAGRMKTARGLGVYVVEGKTGDEEVLPFLKQLVDGVIELRAGEGRLFMRAVGPRGAIPWIPYRVEAGQILPEGETQR
jgi:KaiC/GvpD/RAD55 family RecA-like ATPase